MKTARRISARSNRPSSTAEYATSAITDSVVARAKPRPTIASLGRRRLRIERSESQSPCHLGARRVARARLNPLILGELRSRLGTRATLDARAATGVPKFLHRAGTLYIRAAGRPIARAKHPSPRLEGEYAGRSIRRRDNQAVT